MNTPMQGLPNFIVYLYPLMKKAQNKNPNRGFWGLLKISLAPSRPSNAAVAAAQIHRSLHSPSRVQSSITMTDNDHTEYGIMELEPTINNPRREQPQPNSALTVSEPLTVITVTEEVESKKTVE
jgi:hypothetical protein